ncbi:MAG: enoyl-CoA hydratase [Natronomonas sp.]|jgi:enoyl-CoA hydratase|uniref:enoyl-CoA hydratase/isomerase family protein n=1 Tax=Natronomonas sp. TaxID=2184060 RepID=UPI003988FD07
MIHVEDDGEVRVVTLDRPKRRNALTPELLDALETAVVDAPTPVVYLRGEGEAFCAGADLSVVAKVAESGDVKRFVRRGQRVADSIETTDSVVVAGIDGAARGGGVELALACDIRLATEAATFGEPGVTFGLFGAWGGTVRLPEIVGLGNALDFSLSGRVIDADEARRIGLVSRVVDDPHDVAKGLTKNDKQALGVLKERVRDRGAKADQEDAEVAAFERLVAAHAEELATYGE